MCLFRDQRRNNLTACRVAGALAPVVNADYFVSTQLPHLRAHPLLETERVIALQLGNLYLLLCLLGLFILNTTTERAVVRGYVWALWIGDIGHVGATAYVMGTSTFLDFGNYNATTIGNVTATCFLFAVRSLYLLGLLGKDRVPQRQADRKLQ